MLESGNEISKTTVKMLKSGNINTFLCILTYKFTIVNRIMLKFPKNKNKYFRINS